MLLFLAADGDAFDALLGETRRYLAWKSVQGDISALNIVEEHQKKQVTDAVAHGDTAVGGQLESAYSWLLAPYQPQAVMPPGTPTPIDAVRLSGNNDFGATGTVLQRASYRAVSDEHLITRWGPPLLQRVLGEFSLWQDADHLGVRQLWHYLATYLYLPRLKDRDVLLNTIKTGAPAATSSAMR